MDGWLDAVDVVLLLVICHSRSLIHYSFIFQRTRGFHVVTLAGPDGSIISRGLFSVNPSLRPPLKGSIIFCLPLRACVIHSCRESDLHSRQPRSRLWCSMQSGKRTGWTKRVLGPADVSVSIITLSYYTLPVVARSQQLQWILKWYFSKTIHMFWFWEHDSLFASFQFL